MTLKQKLEDISYSGFDVENIEVLQAQLRELNPRAARWSLFYGLRRGECGGSAIKSSHCTSGSCD